MGKIIEIKNLVKEFYDPGRLLDIFWKQNYRRPVIVFSNGVMDLLTIAHVRSLQFAAKQGDYLIVGINSDKSAKRLKGDSRPIIPQEQRAEILAALECIDYVVIYDEDTPLDIVKQIKPDIIVKGEDWKNKVVIGSDIAKKVCFAPFAEGISTTAIIEKIWNLKKQV